MAAEQARVDFLNAQRMFIAHFAQLATYAGQHSLQIHPVTGTLVEPSDFNPEEYLQRDVEESPLVKRAQADEALGEARLKDARRERVPNLNVTAAQTDLRMGGYRFAWSPGDCRYRPGSLERRLQFPPGTFPPGIQCRDEGLRQLRSKPLWCHEESLEAKGINLIEAGGHYGEHCAACHSYNGGGETKFHGIMYPRPTDLRSDDTQEMSDGELYCVIKKSSPNFSVDCSSSGFAVAMVAARRA